MKTVLVRCWKIGPHRELLITYPEGDMGHRLICCKTCGQIYAVNVTKQLYIEPDINKHLGTTRCLKCAAPLVDNWVYYPDQYVGRDGKLCDYERPIEIPSDADSIVESFPEVYS